MRKIILLQILSFVITTISFGQASIDNDSFNSLVNKAQLTHSSALIIYKNGMLHYENYFGKKKQKIEAMSSTKSIVSLAIGKLLTDSLIRSIDQPVYEFFPEWNEGLKKEITIRHLLNHTSGLQNHPNTTIEIYPSKDFVKLALDAEVIESPGTVFRYNNKAVNLLAGIIEKASGKKIGLPDDLLTELESLKGTYTESAWREIASTRLLNSKIWKEEYNDLLIKNKIALSRKEYTDPIGYGTIGYLGNNMFVNPEKNIVVVRMITNREHAKSKDSQSDFSDFFDFASRL